MHEEPSKSALKREAQRLQKIGLRLTQLKPDVRARIDLPEALRQAIETMPPSKAARVADGRCSLSVN